MAGIKRMVLIDTVEFNHTRHMHIAYFLLFMIGKKLNTLRMLITTDTASQISHYITINLCKNY